DDPARELRVPFHVGDDRSRTWVLTRVGPGLRLKHDHRHEDGSDDAVTMYGGESVVAGTAQRQEFPVDAESVALFEREGLAASVTNTWAMEIEPGQRFVYELTRPGGREFKVEFELARPVDPPPAPWGSDAAQESRAAPATPGRGWPGLISRVRPPDSRPHPSSLLSVDLPCPFMRSAASSASIPSIACRSSPTPIPRPAPPAAVPRSGAR